MHHSLFLCWNVFAGYRKECSSTLERFVRGRDMEHRTGLEDAYVIKENKKLRMGYTTGSCAAAAAKAAAKMLLAGQRVEETTLMTPKGILLHLWMEEIRMKRGADGSVEEVQCAVRKDGGDDPDVTHNALIFASVCRQEKEITIDGGVGVGRVTKPGLSQPVGAAAINPVPRKMILKEVQEICEACGYAGGLKIIISVPIGEEIAKKTFNPRLGIVGGISILGTSGIVVPMSEEALIASIRLEMQMLTAQGNGYLLITPGNYGEAFAATIPKLNQKYEMKCSNYVGETLDMAVELGIKGILFIAHIGKFIKVSGGIMNTHSRNADCRAELMAAAYLRAGGNQKTAAGILETLTTEEALELLAREGEVVLERTIEQVCKRVEFYLQNRCRNQLKTGAILFSQVRGKLGETSQVPGLIRALNGETGT